ncbi:MAG: hypothetical protein ACYC3I_08275 [Gemmataceae bacterium]
MARFFTHGWQYTEARKEPDGEPLGHAASSRFSSRGIEAGDFVYVVAVHRGELYLLGKMQVGKVVTKDEARRLLGVEPYDAPEQAIASACTRVQLTKVPLTVVKELRFVSSSRKEGLAFREEDVLDRQTVRGVRELDAESASRLDELLGEIATFVPQGRSFEPQGNAE